MEKTLKDLLKNLKQNESTISTVFGGLLLLMIAAGATTYFLNRSPQPQITPESASTQASVENQNTSQVAAATLSQHTVVAGETLWSIAEEYYNSGYNWQDLAAANELDNPSLIEPGMKLTLPEVDTLLANGERVPTEAEPDTAASQKTTTQLAQANTPGNYTVQPGDFLWKIAQDQYGDGHQWTRIWQANREQIPNPSIIESGWQLTIPQT